MVIIYLRVSDTFSSKTLFYQSSRGKKIFDLCLFRCTNVRSCCGYWTRHEINVAPGRIKLTLDDERKHEDDQRERCEERRRERGKRLKVVDGRAVDASELYIFVNHRAARYFDLTLYTTSLFNLEWLKQSSCNFDYLPGHLSLRQI